jgi:membrane protease YdiL (CAAX protease family)
MVGPASVSVIVLHYKLAPYPNPLPLSIDKRREILETLVLWLIAISVVTTFMFSLSIDQLSNPTPGLVGQRILLGLIPEFLGPLLYVIYVKKWTLRELGFSIPRAHYVTLYSLIFFAVGELLIFSSGREPLPVIELVWSLYQPAFIEEFFFRGILQGKLERAVGQNKGWIYSGILFGLAHAPADFLGPYWFGLEGNIVSAVFLLMRQIVSGWIFGLIFTKTRSLLPSMVAHYFADGRLGSIIIRLFV